MRRTLKFTAMLLVLVLALAFSGSALALTVYADTFRFPEDLRAQAAATPTAAPQPETTSTPHATQDPVAMDSFNEYEAVVDVAEDESDETYINVYATADAAGEVVAQLLVGSTFTVIGTEGDWLKIRVNELEGYIEGRYAGAASAEQESAPRSLYIWLEKPDEVELGDTLSFHCEMSGYEEIEYTLNWQCAPLDANGNIAGEWQNVAGANDLVYCIVLTEALSRTSWRMAVTYTE